MKPQLETGCRATEQTQDVSSPVRRELPKRSSQADQLVELAGDMTLFHTPDRQAFATIPVGSHTEKWPVRSKMFRAMIRERYYARFQGVPSEGAMQDALATLEGQAEFKGPEHPVFHRIAGCHGRIYIDLVNESWEVVEVDANGWRIVRESPVKFRRFDGMRPLPLPSPGGTIKALRPFLNVGSEADFVLFVSSVLFAFSPRGPYPILLLNGEQGSAKTTTARIFRALVDPSASPVRAEPDRIQDVMIAASTAWIICFDNLSKLTPALSDALCRVSTGGGFSKRALYTDAEEVIFNAQRPIILNGIEELSSRPDLLDRAVVNSLPSIPERKRLCESEFWESFRSAQPKIFGALLDALVAALRNRANVVIPDPPRLADFATFVTAAEPGLGWPAGTFMAAYRANRAGAHELALESLPLPAALQALPVNKDWTGTATELLRYLRTLVDATARQDPSWPSNPRALSNTLRRFAPNLRSIGITIVFSRATGRNRDRLITVHRHASTSSSMAPQKCERPLLRTQADEAPLGKTVMKNVEMPAEIECSDDADDADDEIPAFDHPEPELDTNEFVEDTL